MKDHSDDWRSLCELASKENDPRKLLDLITRINRALEETHRRSQQNQVAMKAIIVPNAEESQRLAALLPILFGERNERSPVNS